MFLLQLLGHCHVHAMGVGFRVYSRGFRWLLEALMMTPPYTCCTGRCAINVLEGGFELLPQNSRCYCGLPSLVMLWIIQNEYIVCE
jgi:hypothetical protein